MKLLSIIEKKLQRKYHPKGSIRIINRKVNYHIQKLYKKVGANLKGVEKGLLKETGYVGSYHDKKDYIIHESSYYFKNNNYYGFAFYYFVLIHELCHATGHRKD